VSTRWFTRVPTRWRENSTICCDTYIHIHSLFHTCIRIHTLSLLFALSLSNTLSLFRSLALSHTHEMVREGLARPARCYGMATISRLLKNIGLFCKETYNFDVLYNLSPARCYGMATISRLLKIRLLKNIGLFCKRDLQF